MDIAPLFGISLTISSLPPPVLVYWRTPLVRYYKVNTDGCVKDGFSSGGRIIRDSSDLWIESDSTLAIHCIIRGGGPWSIQAILRHIRHLFSSERDVISHIYLESNQVADLLASKGWNRRCYFKYSAHDLPQRYSSLVQIDRHGLPTIRGL
ncbi:Ribonuclease H protein [Abeliophyllum distichum]|uniref:Ribonuclease H protein n=1 Tax=Abeliophyllum distichum TaxID=126358 RepID=A0ABD1Q9S6_9LAMI